MSKSNPSARWTRSRRGRRIDPQTGLEMWTSPAELAPLPTFRVLDRSGQHSLGMVKASSLDAARRIAQRLFGDGRLLLLPSAAAKQTVTVVGPTGLRRERVWSAGAPFPAGAGR